ncbi:MAG: hypothetical protein ABSB59_36775 [Streptosporangiaceae bacterium]
MRLSAVGAWVAVRVVPVVGQLAGAGTGGAGAAAEARSPPGPPARPGTS